MSEFAHVHVHVCVSVYVCVCVCVRERDRETERETEYSMCVCMCLRVWWEGWGKWITLLHTKMRLTRAARKTLRTESLAAMVTTCIQTS